MYYVGTTATCPLLLTVPQLLLRQAPLTERSLVCSPLTSPPPPPLPLVLFHHFVPLLHILTSVTPAPDNFLSMELVLGNCSIVALYSGLMWGIYEVETRNTGKMLCRVYISPAANGKNGALMDLVEQTYTV